MDPVYPMPALSGLIEEERAGPQAFGPFLLKVPVHSSLTA